MKKLILFLVVLLITTSCNLLSNLPEQSTEASITPHPSHPTQSTNTVTANTDIPSTPIHIATTVNTPDNPDGEMYFVDINGADTNPGNQTAPWQSLQYAVEQAQPGDTILVQSGRYEGLRIESSGLPEAWITLKAAPNADVLIDSPGTLNAHDSLIEVETWEGDGIVAYWIIEGFELANATGSGIDIRGDADNHNHHITIRNNTVYGSGTPQDDKSGIFTAFTDYITIEHNQSFENTEHGIYHSNSGDHFIIKANQIHNNTACGIHLNGDIEMGGDGILSEGTVEANTIYENGDVGGAAINMDGVSNSLIINNLLYDNKAGGIAIFQGNGAICSSNNLLAHNTIIMPQNSRWAVNIPQEDCRDNKLYNNVLYSYDEWNGAITIATPQLAGFESDYNALLGRFSIDGDNTVIDLSTWQSHNWDTHSFISEPSAMFSNDSYQPNINGPLVDAGLSLEHVTIDIANTARPSGSGYDIGAFELPPTP